MKNLPKYLYRNDDGAQFVLNGNGKYFTASSVKYPDSLHWEYSYERLIRDGFKEKLEDCEIQPMVCTKGGCGKD